ncbi:MAG: MMPL family transporter [Mariprofundaceae bacterium]
MQRLFKVITHWPKSTIVVVLVATLALAGQMRHMQISTDTEAFIPAGHEATLNNDYMKETFGTADLLWVGVFHDDGIYQPETLQLITKLTEKIRLLPGVVDEDVISLATEDNIRGTADGMDVTPFMEQVPTSLAESQKLRKAMYDFDLFQGLIVANDDQAAAILVELEPQELLAERGLDKFAVYQSIQQLVLALGDNRPETFHIAGLPVAEATLGLYISEDMSVMMPLVFITLMVLLFFTYRSFRGVLVPMSVVMLSVVAAMGIMAGVGVPMYPTTSMVPVTLMAIGVADGIHILGKYYEIVLADPTRDKRQIVLDTMDEMYMPVILTSLTTAAGFLSFLMMEMVPLQMMGLFAAVGIIYAMLVSLTLVPATLMLMPAKASRHMLTRTKAEGLKQADSISAFLAKLGEKVAVNSTKTLLITSALLFAAAWAASLVYVDDAYIANFEKDSQVVKADHAINDHFVGSYQRNLLVNTNRPDAFHEPKLLNAIVDFQQDLAQVQGVGKSISIADYIRRMHRVMNENNPEMNVIPDSSDLIAQYLLLYSFSGAPDDFAEVITSDYSQANIRIFCTADRFIEGRVIEAETLRLIDKHFTPLGLDVRIAGNGHIGFIQTEMITNNLRFNIMATIAVIFLFAWAMMRSLVAGVFVMVPVLAAVILNFAVMGLTGVTIGWGSSMFTSIAICIGVDYAIHLIYKFKHEYQRHHDSHEALAMTLATTGKTILFNAVVVIAGFLVLLASVMPPNQQMGLLVSAAMLASFIATLTVLPALIMTAKPKFIFNGEK